MAAVCTSLALATLRKDPREALRWAERAVEMNTRQLGPRHPSTATALNGLCTALNGLQRYKEAETHARAALAILRDLQGETPRFHTVRMNLVTSLAGQLRLDEAEAEVRAAGAYLKHRDDSFGVLLDKLSGVSEGDWNEMGKFYVGDQVIMEAPRQQLAWVLFLDSIHHRGQLTTHLRPMGSKVPSLYGPSADDMGQGH